MARILLYDLETTNLVANIGNILCIGYKWHGEGKPKVLSLRDYPGFKKDPTDDRRLVKDFARIFHEADMQVTWFGTRFDFPYLQSRLLWHGMKPLPEIRHFDGWWVAKKKLKLHSNRLATVQDFLDLPSSKTPLNFRELARSRAGHIPSLKSVERHCYFDVEVLEQAYDKIKSYAGRYHPNLSAITGDLEACPTCGSNKLQRRGFKYAHTRVYRQIHCQECGRWFQSTRCEPYMTAKVV